MGMNDEWEQRIITWLSEEGILYLRKPAPKLDFQFVITYPPGSTYTIAIGKKKESKDSILLQSGVHFLDELLLPIQQLNKHEQKNLIYELAFFLGTLRPSYRSKISKNGILQGFYIENVIYFDGLTKHRLFSVISEIHRAKVLGLGKVERLLGIPLESKPDSDLMSDRMYA